jgi:hypothetical protein
MIVIGRSLHDCPCTSNRTSSLVLANANASVVGMAYRAFLTMPDARCRRLPLPLLADVTRDDGVRHVLHGRVLPLEMTVLLGLNSTDVSLPLARLLSRCGRGPARWASGNYELASLRYALRAS